MCKMWISVLTYSWRSYLTIYYKSIEFVLTVTRVNRNREKKNKLKNVCIINLFYFNGKYYIKDYNNR